MSITNKYRNREKVVDGIVFQSTKESRRYEELKLLEKSGQITDLKLQPYFILQLGFTDFEEKRHRPITYTADFQYVEKGLTIVEDVKPDIKNPYYYDRNGKKKKRRYTGKTEVYMLKKKLLLYTYEYIIFREV